MNEELSMNKHYWSFCMQCERDMVVCGSCGNNTCNGGECCDKCAEAYEFEKNSKPDTALGLWKFSLKWYETKTRNWYTNGGGCFAFGYFEIRRQPKI